MLALVAASCGGGKGTSGTAGTTGIAGVGAPAGMSGTGGGAASGGGGSAGVAGDAGVSGSAGMAGNTTGSGSGGFGGDTGPTCNPTVINCGDALCGNGAIDSCTIPIGPAPCPTITFTEACDGTLFSGGKGSCAAIGYGSGALSCKSDCNLDSSKCIECATGSRIATCGAAPIAAKSTAIGIAAANNEIGIGWMALSGLTPGPLTFARLSPTLQLLSTTSIEDASFAAATSFVEDVRVAPLPTGWVVAAWGQPELFLHVLDAAGRDLGRTTVDTVPDGPKSTDMAAMVAPRPGGGPLLVWQVDFNTLRSAVVAADGRSVSTPRVLPFDARVFNTTAAFVGGAFYIVAAVNTPSFPPAPPLRMVRIETDGTVGTPVDVAGIQAIRPALVAGADDLRLFYRPDSGVTQFRKITASGTSASDPVGVDLGPDNDRPPSAAAFGADTVALVPSRGGGLLSGIRLGADGRIVTPLFTIVASPGSNRRSNAQILAQVGSDLVTPWYTNDAALHLARVTP